MSGPEVGSDVSGAVETLETLVNTLTDNVSALDALITALTSNVAIIDALVDRLIVEMQHTTGLFPVDTDETVTLTAGDVANTFGAWAEVVDNNAVSFSTVNVDDDVHLASIMIESTSVKDKAYVIELSHGDSNTVITRYRFIAGDISKLPAIQQIRIRAGIIPQGETIYYRMKCETADATATAHFRYHVHNG